MLKYLSVSSHRLHQRRLRLAGSQLVETATLLPFFDEQGKIQRVMVVSPDRFDIRFFRPSEMPVRVPLWGTIEILSDFPTLRVLDYEDLEALTRLWHYDPWWLLTMHKRWEKSRAVVLKQTNCVDRMLLKSWKLQRLTYSRDLTRVRAIISKKNGSAQVNRFQSKYLPPRSEMNSEPQMRPRPRWCLEPIWNSRLYGAEPRNLDEEAKPAGPTSMADITQLLS